jgi:FtsP/CotA-like multicopper oxidase with cupredoxin domain
MPGPTIEASWGDTVVVTVNNKLQENGTSIHFHGVRQLNTNEMDGVPSITQCPIAPGSSMTYTWVATNYGTSWYHSHFAIQTWEGVFGPMVIDGPKSATFDVDIGTFMLQDWGHVTVDSQYDLAQNATPVPGGNGSTFGGPVVLDTGLINGKNTFGPDGSANQTGERLTVNVNPSQTNLLHVINSAIQSSFVFSIDGHSFTVISNDFVPIVPYTTDVLHINIGESTRFLTSFISWLRKLV